MLLETPDRRKENGKNMEEKKRLLLHSCCGPCSTHSLAELMKEYTVVMYWYNPNIHPYGEYEKRLDAGKEVAEKLGAEIIEAEYDVQNWLDMIKGFEEEPEGGRRCSVCFSMRLRRAADYAKEHGFEALTTTMTISPHKDADVINKVGRFHCEKNGVEWVHSNFKKNNGFLKSVEMSKKMGLYRQKFCGCFYSRRNKAGDTGK